MEIIVLPLLALLTATQVATPAPTPTPCIAVAPLPAELSGWQQRSRLIAATSAHDRNAAALTIGAGATVTLAAVTRIAFPVPPAKPAAAGSNGGLLSFAVTKAGRYRIALGGGAWIDVVRDGKAVSSIAHGHGPACSAVKKMVDFDLAPGRYMLQFSGSASPTLDLLVAALTK